MGLRFRRSIKLAPGLRMNFSGSGIGLTAIPLQNPTWPVPAPRTGRDFAMVARDVGRESPDRLNSAANCSAYRREGARLLLLTDEGVRVADRAPVFPPTALDDALRQRCCSYG